MAVKQKNIIDAVAKMVKERSNKNEGAIEIYFKDEKRTDSRGIIQDYVDGDSISVLVDGSDEKIFHCCEMESFQVFGLSGALEMLKRRDEELKILRNLKIAQR